MRVSSLLPALLGLAALNGCGGSGTTSARNPIASTTTKTLHYTVTDLGALPAIAIPTGGTTTSKAALHSSQRGLRDVYTTTSASPVENAGTAFFSLKSVVLNNSAQAITTSGGSLDVQAQAQASLYQNGKQTQLGTLGGAGSFGYDVNDSGQAVGAANLAGDKAYHAFVYAQGQLKDLGTLGGANSAAFAINEAAQIAGVSDTQTIDTAVLPQSGVNAASPHLFLYQNGQMRDIGTPGGYSATPYAINANGIIVGALSPSYTSYSRLAFTYSSGVYTTLLSLGGAYSSAFGINASGLIVGQSSTNGTLGDPGFLLHAAAWQDGRVTDLGTLPGGAHSIAFGVNAQGDIVGGSTAAPNSASDLGFILPHNGKMLDLNTLIPANTGWQLLSAQSINDKGQIAGIGFLNKQVRAYLLTPNTAASSSTIATIKLPAGK